jgi:hypothetical protein
MRALEKERASIDAFDEKALRELQARKEALQQQHQERMTEIANKAELERMQFALDAQRAVMDGFTNFFAKAADDIKNWHKAFSDAIKSITSELNKLAAQQFIKQIAGPGTPFGGAIGDFFKKVFGGGEATGAGTLTAAGTTLTAAGTGLTAAATALSAAAATLSAGGMAGGIGGLSNAFPGGAGFASFFGLPFFDAGTPFVPRDTLAFIHRGEAVVPAAQNRRGGPGGLSVTINNAITGPVDTRTMDQIARAAASGVHRAYSRQM